MVKICYFLFLVTDKLYCLLYCNSWPLFFFRIRQNSTAAKWWFHQVFSTNHCYSCLGGIVALMSWTELLHPTALRVILLRASLVCIALLSAERHCCNTTSVEQKGKKKKPHTLLSLYFKTIKTIIVILSFQWKFKSTGEDLTSTISAFIYACCWWWWWFMWQVFWVENYEEIGVDKPVIYGKSWLLQTFYFINGFRLHNYFILYSII